LNLQYRNQLCFTENNKAWHFFISSKNSNGIVFYNCYFNWMQSKQFSRN